MKVSRHLALAFAAATSAGIVAGIAATTLDANLLTPKGATSSKTLFLDPGTGDFGVGQNPLTPQYRYAAYTFQGQNYKWWDLAPAEDGLYCVSIDQSWPNIIFCAMDLNNKQNDWAHKRQQTVDLGVPTNADNLCTIGSKNYDKFDAAWSFHATLTLDASDLVLEPGSSASITASFPVEAQVSWSTDNENVEVPPTSKAGAPISVKALKVGETVITATVQHEGKTYQRTCTIKVQKASKRALTLDIGKNTAWASAEAILSAVCTNSKTGEIETIDLERATPTSNFYCFDFDLGRFDQVAFARLDPKTRNEWNKSASVNVNPSTKENVFALPPNGWSGCALTSDGKANMVTLTLDYGFKVGLTDETTPNYKVTVQWMFGEKLTSRTGKKYGKKAIWKNALGEDCTNVRMVEEGLNLTATWVNDRASWNEFYYIMDADDLIPTNANLYGKDEIYWFAPGVPICTDDVAHTVHFGGIDNRNGKIVRVQYDPASSSDKLKLNNGDTYAWETAEILLQNGFGYNGSADINGSKDLGEAAKLIFDIEDARNAVVIKGPIKQYSICGIAPEKCKELYDRYTKLSPEAKAYVDKSTTFTYVGDGTDKQIDVTFEAIFGQLRVLANKAAQGANLIPEGKKGAALISAAGLLGLGVGAVGLSFLKRRKSLKK